MKTLILIAAGVIVFFVAAAAALALAGRTKNEKPENASKQSVTIGDITLTTGAPEADGVFEQGKAALKAMAEAYSRVREPEVRDRINELMIVTDMILCDAREDEADIKKIKKFFNLNMPSVLKLLDTYCRIDMVGEGYENHTRTRNNIVDMLDTSIDAFKKMLDSLFADQALDIETEIDVMNKLYERQGLVDNKDFRVLQSSK